MTTKTKKTEKKSVSNITVELVEQTKKGEKRKTKYGGDVWEDAYHVLEKLRKENHPHIEVTDNKKGGKQVYTKKPGQQNYRLTFSKTK